MKKRVKKKVRHHGVKDKPWKLPKLKRWHIMIAIVSVSLIMFITLVAVLPGLTFAPKNKIDLGGNIQPITIQQSCDETVSQIDLIVRKESASKKDINKLKEVAEQCSINSQIANLGIEEYAETVSAGSGTCEESMASDLNGDGIIGINDFLILLGNWGCSVQDSGICPADINDDGIVGINDFLILLGNWGPVQECFTEVCDGTDGTIILDDVRNKLLGSYMQVCDIDLASWGEFEPIGLENEEFFGVYDGNGYTISNFEYNNPTREYVGLFGKIIGGAIIKNVNLINVEVVGMQNVGGLVGHSFVSTITDSSVIGGTVSGTVQWVGGLIGHAHPGTIMSDLSVEGVIVSGPSKVGGLAGNHHGSSLDNSFSSGIVIGDEFVGGLIGYMQEGPADTVVTNSYSTADVNGINALGGLVGWVEHNDQPGIEALIENSYATGNVNGTGEWTGGLVGYLGRNNIITSSYATGNVNGQQYTGGLVGYMNVSNIINSHSMSSVSSTEGSGGGLVGYQTNSIIENSYSGGNVGSGLFFIGGLVGYVIDNSIVNNSHSNSDVFTSNSSFGVGGLAGVLATGSIIENSYATGSVNSGLDSVSVGGLIGIINTLDTDVIVRDSYAIGGTVSSEGYYIGGLVGAATSEGTGRAHIIRSFSTKNVAGILGVGGLIGLLLEGGKVSDSYAKGSVNSLGNGAGGLIGEIAQSFVNNSYATGMVTGAQQIGGLIGKFNLDSSIAYSYWDNETSGQSVACGFGVCNGATGLPTTQMQMQSTYEPEWDFETIWDIIEDESYPFFQ